MRQTIQAEMVEAKSPQKSSRGHNVDGYLRKYKSAYQGKSHWIE